MCRQRRTTVEADRTLINHRRYGLEPGLGPGRSSDALDRWGWAGLLWAGQITHIDSRHCAAAAGQYTARVERSISLSSRFRGWRDKRRVCVWDVNYTALNICRLVYTSRGRDAHVETRAVLPLRSHTSGVKPTQHRENWKSFQSGRQKWKEKNK